MGFRAPFFRVVVIVILRWREVVLLGEEEIAALEERIVHGVTA